MRHVHVYLLLHAGDAFHATGDQHVVFPGDDALRRQGDGLQARGAKAVDGQARGRDRQARLEGDQPRHVGAGGAFGQGAAHDDIFDQSRVDAGPLHGMAHGVAAQGGAIG